MKKILLLGALALTGQMAIAEELGAISPRVSTLGLGLEYKYPVSNEVAVSAGIYGYNYSRSDTRSDVD